MRCKTCILMMNFECSYWQTEAAFLDVAYDD
jgi:hypothetical protein